MGGERRAGALTQHQHPLPQGWMRVAAPASLAIPEGDVKGLPGVPRAWSSRSLFTGRTKQEIAGGSGEFCHAAFHGPLRSSV